MGHSARFHHGLHIREVKVDGGGQSDQVRDALNALAEHIVSNTESFQHGSAFANHLKETVIGNDHQCIHILLQLVDAHLRVAHALLALKLEGLGDNGDGETAQFSCDISHNRRSAGACAAAHTGGDKDKVGSLQQLSQLFTAFLSGALADFGHSTRAQPFGQLFSDLQGVIRMRSGKRLAVRIHSNKVDALQFGLDHAVHGIGTAAAASDYFDRRKRIFGLLLVNLLQFKHGLSSSCGTQVVSAAEQIAEESANAALGSTCAGFGVNDQIKQSQRA